MKFKKVIIQVTGILIIGLVIFIFSMSLTPRNAVRTKILFSGHIITAFKCNPKKNDAMTKNQKLPVWGIEKKYAYLDSSASYYEQYFKINNFVFFKYAISLPPSA